MIDLASRALGGVVVAANDELFADRRNLIEPAAPTHDPAAFNRTGKVYDGWETRRRRTPGHDHAIVRLGAPGIVRRVVVDTAYFTGNYPPFASVEAVAVEGYPAPDELTGWTTLVPRSALNGDAENTFDVTDDRRWTHLRLSIHPDGGVARFRAFGDVVPDPRLLTGTIDLASALVGGTVTDCSNMFYSAPGNLLLPGSPAGMAAGWETSRRRDDGNDWVVVRLGAAGRVRRVELDTTHFHGNAPGAARLTGSVDGATWTDLLPRTGLQPDTRHLFAVTPAAPVAYVRLDVYPDGGLARLRVHGELSDLDGVPNVG